MGCDGPQQMSQVSVPVELEEKFSNRLFSSNTANVSGFHVLKFPVELEEKLRNSWVFLCLIHIVNSRVGQHNTYYTNNGCVDMLINQCPFQQTVISTTPLVVVVVPLLSGLIHFYL